MKLKEGSLVQIKKTKQTGIIAHKLPNPYVPDCLNWLAGYSYVVNIEGCDKHIYAKKELKLLHYED